MKEERLPCKSGNRSNTCFITARGMGFKHVTVGLNIEIQRDQFHHGRRAGGSVYRIADYKG